MKRDSRDRVLIVDDNEQNRQLLRAMLSSEGLQIDMATDGPAALRMVQQTAPDLILLDVVMPGMDDYAVCRQLKAEETTRDIPIIFVTGKADVEAETQALAAGAADYLTKPLSLPIVRARVRTQLALHRQRRSLEGMFRDVIEFAPDAFILADTAGRIVRINIRTEQLFGHQRGELIGLPVETLIPSRLRGAHENHRKAFAQDPHGLRMGVAVSCLRKDGSEFPADINLSPLRTSHGPMLMAVVRDVSENNRIQQELRSSRQLLREMTAQATAMLEDERKSIAREVHDELGQVLTALRMDLTFAEMRFGDQGAELVDKIRDMRLLVDRAIQGVRNVATSLRPAALDMGLASALEWLCSDFSCSNRIPCRFEQSGQFSEVPEEQANSLFRIVQESLTNVSRYAQATEVRVSLQQQADQLLLQVRDNGKGFDPDEVARRKSFGLLGMKERALALGGALMVSAAPGRGTVIQVTVPPAAVPTPKEVP